MAKTTDMTCGHCKKNYFISEKSYKSKIKKGAKNFFCSFECVKFYRKVIISINNVKCLACKKEFYRSKSQIEASGKVFCSSSCSATWNNKGKQKNPPKSRVCVKCNDVYYRINDNHSIYCNKCRNNLDKSIIDSSLTVKECIEKIALKGKHPSWKKAYIRNRNCYMNKSIKGGPCQVCGYSKHTELAHIKPISSFPETAIISEINSSDNILVLCPNHHREFDSGDLELSDIPPRGINFS